MLSRPFLVGGAMPILGLWWAMCNAAVRPFHPASLFPALMIFLGSLAVSAYRLRRPSVSWLSSFADRHTAEAVEPLHWPLLAPHYRPSDLAAYIVSLAFTWHALLFIPSIGVGMLTAAFCSEEEKNPLLG